MAIKKLDTEAKPQRQTLSKQLRASFPELFKKARGGPRISTAALALLSPTLRASVMAEMKKVQGVQEVPYEPTEIGEMILDFYDKR